jgi:ATP-dependent Clp protease ATP-binding subunit ClpA
MIFMTTNLGASEMNALTLPRFGFQTAKHEPATEVDENLTLRMVNSGVEAARRKFTPEFMNRIDKIAVFRPLGRHELLCILNLELAQLQRRILHTSAEKPFVFRATDAAKTFLLTEGTDVRYGARPLKRAMERLLVHPLSNLIASNQVGAGDWIELGFDDKEQKLSFAKIGEGLPLHAMVSLIENGLLTQAATANAA